MWRRNLANFYTPLVTAYSWALPVYDPPAEPPPGSPPEVMDAYQQELALYLQEYGQALLDATKCPTTYDDIKYHGGASASGDSAEVVDEVRCEYTRPYIQTAPVTNARPVTAFEREALDAGYDLPPFPSNKTECYYIPDYSSNCVACSLGAGYYKDKESPKTKYKCPDGE